MFDLGICSIEESMVIYDTECPYWDQESLNNTKLKPNPVMGLPLTLDISFIIHEFHYLYNYFINGWWNYLAVSQ